MTEAFDTRYCPENEIAKYRFLEELQHTGRGKDSKTVTMYMNALHEFEVATGFRDFRKFTSEWALDFKHHLQCKKNKQTVQIISMSYYSHYVQFVRQFFEWLVESEPDYKKIKRRDIEYLSINPKEQNQARATNYQESHDIADILATIRRMPETNEMERRNKALFSLFLLTTPRMASIQQARIDRIRYMKEYDAWAFIQDPRLQNTKFSRNITAFFIGDVPDIVENVVSWKMYLQEQGCKGTDYLFPKITSTFTPEREVVLVRSKDYIRSDSMIRDIIKEAFQQNGLEYIKPHNLRHTIARLVKKEPNATDLMIALAQNMGQKNGMATLVTSYGGDPLAIQAKTIKSIRLE